MEQKPSKQKKPVKQAKKKRATVYAELERIVLENDKGHSVPSVRLTCSKCGKTVESFGNTSKSVRRCLALLGGECPNEETNWYEIAEDDTDDE